jgi:hypothetical protein
VGLQNDEGEPEPIQVFLQSELEVILDDTLMEV